jgi:APA family basic amino acid/polyamine antiporter
MFRRKPLDHLINEANGTTHGLKRALNAVNLISLGIGCIIGAGIFVMTGLASAQYAGPSIVISFALSAVACAFAGLCYAEFASMIPIAGSAYTYAYATLGEFVAWIIGWDLILEYLFGASTVAVGWSRYAASFLRDFGIVIPPQLTAPTFSGIDAATLPHLHPILNLPAVLVVAAMTVLLVIGIRESATFNNIIVLVKVTVIVLFIVFGFSYVSTANWSPFIPPNKGESHFFTLLGKLFSSDSPGLGAVWDAKDGWFGEYGWSGILRGAGFIFFAYIGFDAVSTAAQEAKNPKRDMPIGILGSLAICTVLYILVCLVMTGILNYTKLNVEAPVATAVDAAGAGLKWLGPWIKIGAVAGLTSVVMVLLMGQPRIFFAMSHDGLLPSVFAKVHRRFRTPYVTTIATGSLALIVAGVLPIQLLGELVNIGTLLAFVIVCVGVLVLRYRHPELPRAFKTPWVPVVPILGALLALAQMLALPGGTWLRLGIWMAIGLVIYFTYGRWHSRLHKPAPLG